MAFDPTSGRLILFGGGAANSDPPRKDTWSWDGSNWREEHPATAPPVLDHAMMASDRTNRNLVLFGFGGPDLQVPMTWIWNGSNWIQKHPSRSPLQRNNAGLAAGAKSGVLLFGGQPGEAGSLNDSWAWDGDNWSQLHPATNPPGGAVVMAREDGRQDVVMLEMDGTWRWNSSNWTKLTTSAQPPFEHFRAITYDAARDRVVVFGGKAEPNQATNDTWLWDGSSWSKSS